MASRAATKAVELEPLLGDAQNNLALFQGGLSHPEQMLAASRAAVHDFTGPGAHFSAPRAAKVITLESLASIDEALGDYSDAVVQYTTAINSTDFEGSHWLSVRMGAADAALAHDLANSRKILGGAPDSDLLTLCCTSFGWQPPNFDMPQFEQFVALGDWRAASNDIKAMMSMPHARNDQTPERVRRVPKRGLNAMARLLALAEAKTGDMTAARETIGKTALDCYTCLVVRGQIAAITGNTKQAEDWYRRAITFAPSIPFAYADWGQMLLGAHDYDGAIAKFFLANQKGPHFADPLEMWGEALMMKNRSDLALVKFEEAAKYAPNWGLLHLKWGEALFYAGQKIEAKKQFAIAATLDLTPSEKSELSKR